MAERSISVKVLANVGGYLSSMQAAAAATKEFGVSTAATAAKNEKSFTKIGKTAAGGGALILAGLAGAAKATADFDAQMSVVKANIDDKTAPSMKRLSDAALEAGQTTAYSAIDAAKAEEELAKAGLSSAQITGGALTAALNLASAGQLDLGDAAEITASTMVQFGLKASDAADIADTLAAGADKSLGGVQDLAEALKYAGVPASQFGISLHQTVGVLAEFASNGIEGSMAGTSLRQMLLSLASPTKQAQGVMDQYNITMFDGQGKFVGLAGAAQQLHDKLGPLNQKQQQAALSTLFTARSVSTANILMRDGAAGVKKWTNAVDDQGFASKQASTKLDNLNGDLRKLKNTLQVDLIKTGQQSQGVLRGTAKGATFMAQAFGDLPGPAREVATTVGLVTGAGLLLIGTVGTAIPKVQAFRSSLADMGNLGSKLNTGLGILGRTVGIGIPLVAAGAAAWELWKRHTQAAQEQIQELTAAIAEDNGVIGENTAKTVADALQKQGAIDAAKKLGISVKDVTDAVLNGGSALDKLNSKLDAMKDKQTSGSHGLSRMVQSEEHAGDAADVLRGAINGQNEALNKSVHAYKNTKAVTDAAKDSTDGAAKASKKASDATGELTKAQQNLAKANASNPSYALTNALLGLSPAADKGTDKIKALSDALQAYDDLAYGTASASAAAGDALAALAKSKTKNVSVDRILNDNLLQANGNTRALSEKLASLGDQYSKTLDQVYKDTAATKGNNAAIIAVNKTHGQQVAALRHTLKQMGITGKGADDLIKKYASVPDDISTDVQLARVSEAKKDADDVKKHIHDIPLSHTTTAKAEVAKAEQQLASVKQQIRGVPTSKTTALLAEIKRLQEAIQTAKYYIDNDIPRNVQVNINGVWHTPSTGPNGLGTPVMKYHAAGGELRGPGTTTSDSIPFWGSDREWVINARRAQQLGRPFMEWVNNGRGTMPPSVATRVYTPSGPSADEIGKAVARYIRPGVGMSVDNLNVYDRSDATAIFQRLSSAFGRPA